MFSAVEEWSGRFAAQATKFLIRAAGVLCWIIASSMMSFQIDYIGIHGWPSAAICVEQARWLLPWAAVLAASILLQTPSHWLAETGLRLSFKCTLAFAAIAIGVWLFGPQVSGINGLGIIALTCAQLNLVLWGGAALKNKDLVRDAYFHFRRWLNGINKDGSGPDYFDCAIEPLLPVAAFCFAFCGVLWPGHTARFISGMWSSFLTGAEYGDTPHSFVHVSMTQALGTHHFWLIILGITGLILYVVLRRIGIGRASRGLIVWFCSTVVIGGGFVLANLLILQLHERQLGDRLELAAISIGVAAVMWFCHDRRYAMVGWIEEFRF